MSVVVVLGALIGLGVGLWLTGGTLRDALSVTVAALAFYFAFTGQFAAAVFCGCVAVLTPPVRIDRSLR